MKVSAELFVLREDDLLCGAACQAAQKAIADRSAQPGRLRHTEMTHPRQELN